MTIFRGFVLGCPPSEINSKSCVLKIFRVQRESYNFCHKDTIRHTTLEIKNRICSVVKTKIEQRCHDFRGEGVFWSFLPTKQTQKVMYAKNISVSKTILPDLHHNDTHPHTTLESRDRNYVV